MDEKKKIILIGTLGLKGGSMDIHLKNDKFFKCYTIIKTWGLPLIKLFLGIFTVCYDTTGDEHFTTVAIGGFSLILEGLSDAVREYLDEVCFIPRKS
mmetsp:Transcript_3410/g.312  ORF Transcript_3410/g.312 Transcript_3410/m.312 type:complete len:97 (-) Transcript_3410:19-309(-)